MGQEKRKTNAVLNKILEQDVKITKFFAKFLLNYLVFRSLKTHSKFLEVSCHGVAWLATWLGFCWIINNPLLYEMQINMLFGLLIDIVIVAILKAASRRRRPSSEDLGFLSIGPDKFSFPSGHASRAVFIVGFFMFLYPLHVITWPALITWAASVSISRILMLRHHLLDVVAGALLGIVETMLLYFVWLGPDITKSIMLSLSEDYVPGGPE